MSVAEKLITLSGVNFMEKTISIRNTEITFSIWDLGGQREFVNMLPLVCNDAVAILFMFDLTRKSTLNSIKEWYRQARGFNKVCVCWGAEEREWGAKEREPGWLILRTDGDSVPGGHKVRPLCEFCTGGAGGDIEAGAQVCEGDEGELDF